MYRRPKLAVSNTSTPIHEDTGKHFVTSLKELGIPWTIVIDRHVEPGILPFESAVPLDGGPENLT